MRRCVLIFAVLSVVLVAGIPGSGWALNQNPNLNIGNTNMLDGILPPPGLHMLNYMIAYSADDVKTDNPLPPGDHEVSVLAYAPQLVYMGKQTLPGGLHWGLSAILPFQSIDVDSAALTANSDLIGDLAIGPLVGSTLPLGQETALHWFFELDTYLPIGDYDEDKNLNPSANFVSIEPFLSTTLTLPHGLALSTRQHLTFNMTNDDYKLGGVKGDMDAGTLYHFNYSLSKTVPFIDPNFRIGVVGYYLQQLENDEFNGHELDNSKERVFAIGPGLTWIHKGLFLGLKTMFESNAQERPEGVKTVFQIRFKF